MIMSEGSVDSDRIQSEMEEAGIPYEWIKVYSRNLTEFYASKDKKQDKKTHPERLL